MKLTVRRALIISVVLTVTSFVVAGIAGNNQSGVRAAIGDVAWAVALLSAVLAMVLAVVALIQGARRRSEQRSTR